MSQQHLLPASLSRLCDQSDALAERRSLWRRWRALSRLQRSFLLLLLGASVGCALLFLLLGQSPQLQTVSRAPAGVFGGSSDEQVVSNRLISALHPHIPNSNAPAVNVIAGDSGAVSSNESALIPRFVSPLHFAGPTNRRQQAVVDAFRHAWRAYSRDAWGYDHLKPISRRGHNWFGLGLTLVDSLDTMYVMGLNDEFRAARNWVTQSLTFDINAYVNVFETTIRVLGGLLSAHHLSQDHIFLEKAVDLGNRLASAFDTPSGVPYSDVNLRTMKARGPTWNPDSSTAEVATLQLEFNQLSYVSGDERFSRLAMAVSRHINKLPKRDGLVGIFISPFSGQIRSSSTVTLGARGDSYYEYLIKVYQQLGESARFMRDDFERAMRGVQQHLVGHSVPSSLTFIGELESSGRMRRTSLKPKMDHLVCFLPAVLALSVRLGCDSSLLTLSEQLINTCYQMYARQPTGLAPEIVHFNTADSASSGGSGGDIYVKPADAHTLLRPETVESLWYLYHLTGNTTYQHWGWRIFRAIERHARVGSGGYTSLSNVLSPSRPLPRDSMESFFLGETLKYLYLLFSDDQNTLNLRDFVFNSEAHPFPVLRRVNSTAGI